MIVNQVPPHLESKAVRPGSDEYEGLRHSYAHQGSPALIVLCESAADVSSALAHVRSTGAALSVRSGGHGVASSSTNDGGIVLDLSRMNSVEVLDHGTGFVRIGAGARWADVAAHLDKYGLAIGSGDSGDVGVGGLTLYGGIGLLGRKFGLTIDGLQSVVIVTADGLQRHANARENPDLFWAIRGAGGNFGVVVSFEFIANRVRDVVHTRVRYEASDVVRLIERWARSVEEAPREITAFLYLTPSDRGMPVLAESSVLYADGDMEAARDALEPFTTAAPVIDATTIETHYASVVSRSSGEHRGEAPPDVRCGLVEHVTRDIAEAISTILQTDTAVTVQIRAVGGAVNDVDPSETAYAHRHQNFCIIALSLPQDRERLWTAWEQMQPHLDGLYSAFETETGLDQTLAAYPYATLAKLAEVKAKFDPNHLFEPNFVWN